MITTIFGEVSMLDQGLTAVVLAAGVGSRLDPLTTQLPKPLVPFANTPVMAHIVKQLKRHGVTNTVSNLHHLPAQITKYFGDGSQFGVTMTFVEEPELTGDAGGMRALREHIGSSTFLVVMGDLISDLDLTYVITQHREKGALATIALKQVQDVERFGIALLQSDGMIKRFQEKPSPDEALSNLASSGVYVFEPEIFDYIAPTGVVGFGRDVFPELISKGLPVLGVETWGYWSDIGTIAQYRSSTRDALEGLIDIDLPGERTSFGWVGAGSVIGEASAGKSLVLIGSNSYVHEDVRIKGHAVIGDNCVIERGVELQDAIIWPGTIIGARSIIRASVVGMNCAVPADSKLLETAIVEPVNGRGAERMQTLVDSLNSRDVELDAQHSTIESVPDSTVSHFTDQPGRGA